MLARKRYWAVGLGLVAWVEIALPSPVAPAIRDVVQLDRSVDVSSARADAPVPSTTSTTGTAPTRTTATSSPATSTRITRRNTAVRTAPAGCPAIVASIGWPPGWRVDCTGPRAGVRGMTYRNGTTTIFVRPHDSDELLHLVALHEAGHAWDYARLDNAKIARWCASRGCDAAHFFSGGASGPGWTEPPGAEDWAAVWNACHGGSYHRSYLGLAAPTVGDCDLQRALTGTP